MARPLLDIHCIEEPNCEYPAAVKLLMDDGSIQTYVFEGKEPPHIQKARNIFEQSLEISIGYQYRPKRRNRIHLCKR